MRVIHSAVETTSRKSRRERGIALITALLLLALMTGLSVAMYLAVNSDALTTGYYRNFQGSYYAADSGLAIVRQDMKNKITANMVAATSSTPPLALDGIDSAVLTSLKKAWASDYVFKSLTDGTSISDSSAMPAQFRIEPGTFTLVGECKDEKGADCAGQTNVGTWNYRYLYHMVAVGLAGTAHQNRIEESGYLEIKVPVGITIPGTFAGYGMYVTDQKLCTGSTFAPGTIYGPVYTGGCFTFGTSGTVSYTDPVACGGPKAGYQFDKSCVQVSEPKAKVPPTTIAPNFGGGLYFNQQAPELPKDSFNQKQALLDAMGLTAPASDDAWKDVASGTTPVKDKEGKIIIQPLRNVSTGDKYAKNASSGVYISYDPTTKTMTGGGIYVAGNASVSLTTNSSGNTLQQTYTIINNGVTTTITYTSYLNSGWNKNTPYDPPYTQTGVGTVEVKTGNTTTLTLNNISVSRDEFGNPIDNATLLYVDGKITHLSGTVQDDTALTITAASDVTVDGNLKYQTKPITTQANEIYDAQGKGLPADSVYPGNNRGQALGIFTASGNVISRLDTTGNLEIDASIATISQGGTGGLVIPNDSAKINYLTIIGGRINNSLYSTSKLGTRNVYFDRRFGSKLSPPFFPAATPPDYNPPPGGPITAFHRTQWVNQTAY